MALTIDFETFYSTDYTLSKMSTEAYIRDPRFEVIGVGVALDDNMPVWMTPDEFAEFAYHIDWSRVPVLAHHAHFDGLILSHHYGIQPGLWLDTLSMARALHGTEVGGSLGKLARHYGVGEKGTEVLNAKGKHLDDFTAAEYSAYGEYCCTDVELTRDIFRHMLAQGFPQRELRIIDMTVRMFTAPCFMLDGPLIYRALDEERQHKQALLDRIGADKSLLMSNDKFAQALIALGVEPPTKINKKGKVAWAFAKTDPGLKLLMEHPNNSVRWLVEARLGCKSTIGETRAERFAAMAPKGAAPVYLKYAGAHTFRWSGGDKVNWQNLARVNPADPESGKLRRAVLAPPGHSIVVADSAQIEARVLAWLAGQEDILEAFREGRDVYSEFASRAYGRTITKRDTIERFVGKICVLGLGYGMGWAKFAQTMQQGAMGGQSVQFGRAEVEMLGIDPQYFLSDDKRVAKVRELPTMLPFEDMLIHCMVAEEFVRRYRAANDKIAQFWKVCDNFIRLMADGRCSEYTGYTVTPNGIQLPSGLTMRYHELKATGHEYSYSDGRIRKKLYGGLLTENLTQALARQVIAEQMLAIGVKYRVATMTHDEIVCVVPTGQADEALAHMISVMSTPPAWAAALPLAAEGGSGLNYGAAK